jgi:tungstate transport system ATP-binding protein
MTTHPLCKIRDIRHSFGSRTVLDIKHLSIEAGDILGISGPNGCGKSTLLNMLAFLEKPDSGNVLFQGVPYGITPNSVHRKICLLGQEPYLLKRSVRANVGYGLKVRNADQTDARIRESLRMVGLDEDDFLRRMWHELSGGEAQRVALAARLALRPMLLLLDEPTANLDAKSAQTVRNAATEMKNRHGTSLVIVSHDIKWLQSVSTHVIFMERGRIVETTNPTNEA